MIDDEVRRVFREDTARQERQECHHASGIEKMQERVSKLRRYIAECSVKHCENCRRWREVENYIGWCLAALGVGHTASSLTAESEEKGKR